MLAACFPAVPPRRTRLPATGRACAVLVVDDDEWTRLSTARTLRRAGYGVLEAEHAEAALELLDDVAGSCVSLILVDHRLASAGARPLGDRIHSERPDVHLLIATSPPATMTLAGNRSVLEKPFTPDALAPRGPGAHFSSSLNRRLAPDAFAVNFWRGDARGRAASRRAERANESQ